MGYTLTLDLPDSVFQSLAQQAKQAGQSPEVFAAQVLATTARQESEDPLEQFIGSFRSQDPNWADEHDKHLGRSLDDSLRG